MTIKQICQMLEVLGSQRKCWRFGESLYEEITRLARDQAGSNYLRTLLLIQTMFYCSMSVKLCSFSLMYVEPAQSLASLVNESYKKVRNINRVEEDARRKTKPRACERQESLQHVIHIYIYICIYVYTWYVRIHIQCVYVYIYTCTHTLYICIHTHVCHCHVVFQR